MESYSRIWYCFLSDTCLSFHSFHPWKKMPSANYIQITVSSQTNTRVQRISQCRWILGHLQHNHVAQFLSHSWSHIRLRELESQRWRPWSLSSSVDPGLSKVLRTSEINQNLLSLGLCRTGTSNSSHPGPFLLTLNLGSLTTFNTQVP